MKNRFLPNFLVIGAQKSGTTWLYHMLRQHPEVFVPKCKEVHFFNKSENYERGVDWYRSFFVGRDDEKAIGEATPNYFWTSKNERTYYSRTANVPSLVKNIIPRSKIILTLRNPVERAVSAYYEHIRQGRISPRERISDILNLYGILSMGYYDIHLQRWAKIFPNEQFLILIFEEDIAAGNGKTAEKVYQFLDVDPSFVPDDLRQKRKGRKSHLFMRLKPISTRLAYFVAEHMPQVEAIERLTRIPVHQEEREILREEYAPHVDRLEELLGRRLPWS